MDGSDLGWYLSSSGASEGGAMSATPIASGVDNNVFPDITNSARIAGGTMYRKIFLANDHGTDTYPAHSVWIPLDPSHSDAMIGLGFDEVDDDENTAGGLTAWSAGAKVSLASDAADTRSIDVYGLVGGTPTMETVVLNGASEVLTAATFDAAGVYGIHTTLSASRTVTIKQGTGGTTRGTLGPGYVSCFVWISAAAKATGLKLPTLAAGLGEGIWEKVVWAAGAIASAQDLPLATEPL